MVPDFFIFDQRVSMPGTGMLLLEIMTNESFSSPPTHHFRSSAKAAFEASGGEAAGQNQRLASDLSSCRRKSFVLPQHQVKILAFAIEVLGP